LDKVQQELGYQAGTQGASKPFIKQQEATSALKQWRQSWFLDTVDFSTQNYLKSAIFCLLCSVMGQPVNLLNHLTERSYQ
jgi:ribosome modulation factor